MSHITVRRAFKEALESLPSQYLYLGKRDALLLAKEGEVIYPIALLPKKGGIIIKVQRGGHFLDQVSLANVLLSTAENLKGKVLQSTVPARIHPKPTPLQYVTPRVWLEKGKVYGLLGEIGPLLVEVGFGNGEFLEGLINPDRRVVGIEISNWSIRKALGRLRGRDSYIILKAPGAWALRWLFPKGSIDTLYILFPFPWPKKPARRMVQAPFLDVVSRVLNEGGKIVLATDHLEYARDIGSLFMGSPIFQGIHPPMELNTKYLRKWTSQGLKIYKMAYRKAGNGSICEKEDETETLLCYPLEVSIPDPQALWQGFSSWGFPLPQGGYFKVESCLYCPVRKTLLFTTVLQDPDLCLHHTFLFWEKGVMDILSTWGEVITHPLAQAMEKLAYRIRKGFE